jgi:hypothetical protein
MLNNQQHTTLLKRSTWGSICLTCYRSVFIALFLWKREAKMIFLSNSNFALCEIKMVQIVESTAEESIGTIILFVFRGQPHLLEGGFSDLSIFLTTSEFPCIIL